VQEFGLEKALKRHSASLISMIFWNTSGFLR